MSDPRLAALAELVTPGLRGGAAYHVPQFPSIVAKLDANELPHPLSPALAAGLAAELAQVPLERYPAADGGPLRARLAAELGVPAAQVVLGNGSDELIALLISAFGAPRPGTGQAAILYPVPSFVVYRIATLAHNALPVEVALRGDFTLDLAAVEAAIARQRPNVAFFALPNNPTGTLWPPEEIAALAARHPDVIVVSDEAYLAYGGRTLVGRMAALPNLVVMRTLSKIGLAGLRIGYLAAHPQLVAELEKVRPPYNLGSLNLRAATWLLDHGRAWLDACVAEVVRERPRLMAGLRALPGVRVFDSEANLVMIRIGAPMDGRASIVWRALADRGVLVRNFDRPGPLAGCLRITIGTPAENDRLLAALAAVL